MLSLKRSRTLINMPNDNNEIEDYELTDDEQDEQDLLDEIMYYLNGDDRL